jgi:HAD superfamily hydrolase (TIGR01509 family)
MTQPIIRHAIWDVDGTLFDAYPAMCQAFVLALADLGASASLEEINRLARVEVFHCAEVLAARFGLDPNELIRAFGKHYMAIPLADQPPFPGAREVCERIMARGGVNAIVTHRNGGSMAGLLAEHGMQALFAQVITRDDNFPRKPDPAAFVAILQSQHLDPKETLSIGDREIDIRAGRAAGTRTCLFGGGPLEVPADLTIGDYSELLAWLDGQNAPGAPPAQSPHPAADYGG